MKKYIWIIFVILSMILVSCASNNSDRIRPEAGYIPEPVSTMPGKKYAGSLWQEQNSKSLLFADRKAAQVNDIVTVLITEQAKAKGSSSTSTDRNSSYAGEVTELFGLPSSLGMANFLGSGTPFQPKVGGSVKNEFQGTGDTQRQGTLTATVSARVMKVFPNGTLQILGSRQVTINNETQYLVLSGTIRREDISPNNTVMSDSIADARIEFYGEGVLADKNAPGWLARGLDWMWPF